MRLLATVNAAPVGYDMLSLIDGESIRLKKELSPVNDPDKSAVGSAPVNFVVEPLPAVSVPVFVSKVPNDPVIVNVEPVISKVPPLIFAFNTVKAKMLGNPVLRVLPELTVRVPAASTDPPRVFVSEPEIVRFP